jgi:acetyl esterase/lipase
MRKRLIVLILVGLLVSACTGQATVTTPTVPPTETLTPKTLTETPTRLPPTETPESTPTQIPVEVLASETPEPTPTQIPVEVLTSLPYAEVSRRQILDIYLPATGDGPYPTFLAIHGGGFHARSKALYQRIGQHYAQQGYAFVPINYRLAPSDSYPAQVEDSFCALAWLHAHHEEYGFDHNRVVVTGGSAGGYLAAMLGTVDDPNIYLKDCPYENPSGEAVQAVVIYYGFYDFTNIDDYPTVSSLTRFWGAKYEDIPTEKLEEMSPITHIDGSEPPFIILHGTADRDIPSVMSERFAEALEQASVDVELVLLPDVVHAFELNPLTGEEMTFSLNKIEAFLDRVLTP